MLKWFADRLAQTGKDARKDERGFTLIELLVVVIIIGILAAIAIPTFLAQRENAQIATVESDLRNAGTAFAQCVTDTSTLADCDDNSEAELGGYGYNTSADVDFDNVTGDVDDATISASHSENTDITGTFSSASGQVNVTSDPPDPA